MPNSKRTSLIDAVVQVVAQRGFHGASMSMIAERSGVAPGTIYVHFESKDQLIREAYQELEGRFLEKAMKEYPSKGSIRRRFFHLTDGLIRHWMLSPAEFLFVDQFLSSPYVQVGAVSSPMPVGRYGRIAQLFWEGREKQLFKEMPLVMLFALASGPMIQVLRAYLAGMLLLDDDTIAGTVQACWEAVSQAGCEGECKA